MLARLAAMGRAPGPRHDWSRRRRREEWRLTLKVAAVVCLLGLLFGWANSADPNDPLDRILSALQGAVTALFIGVPVIWLEVTGRRTLYARLVDWPFWAYLAFKLLLVALLFVAAMQLGRLLFNLVNPQSFGFDETFRGSLVVALVMSLAVNAIVEVGRLLGVHELRNLLTGRYRKPRRERRVFLMVDLQDSTAAAERLGDLQFHRLLNAFFRHVDEAALDHGADIHKYVGDQVILTWTAEAALRGARCALCPFALADHIGNAAGEYLDRFGLVPAFRSALHAGDIVAGEVGAMKRELAFTGDTLNTTARLLDVARATRHDVVVSGELAARLALPPEVAAIPLEAAVLRGKEKPLPVSALVLVARAARTERSDASA